MKTLARGGALCAALLFVATAHAGDGSCERWRPWQEFKRLYLSEDGRVIDASTPQAITVSEGQAYRDAVRAASTMIRQPSPRYCAGRRTIWPAGGLERFTARVEMGTRR